MSGCNPERKSGQPQSQKIKGMLQALALRGETLSCLATLQVVGLEGKKKYGVQMASKV
jgi:hypothetical protein